MLLYRIWVITALALLALGAVWAQAPSYQQEIADSDIILSGTVTAARDVTPPGGSRTTGLIVERTIEQMTLQPTRVLLGTLPAGPVTVLFYDYDNHKNFSLPKVGDQGVFFLLRAQDGLYMAWPSGVKSLTTLDDIASQINTMPLSVTLTTPAPLYFGQASPVTITLVNHTATPLTITEGHLYGFYYARRIADGLQCILTPFAHPQEQKTGWGDPVVLPAHGTLTLALYTTTMAPPCLALLGADSFLLTLATLHADISFSTGVGDNRQSHIARSNWLDTLVGYPHNVPPQ